MAQAEEASSSSPSENRFSEMRRKAKEVSEKNDADFEGSEFLKGLRDKSDANKARYAPTSGIVGQHSDGSCPC